MENCNIPQPLLNKFTYVVNMREYVGCWFLINNSLLFVSTAYTYYIYYKDINY